MAKKNPFRGLALPARRVAGGYFTPRQGVDRVWSDLMIALLTPLGSRPMRRTFGSTLNSLMFSQLTTQDDPAVALEVTEVAAQWCPQALVTRVLSTPPSIAGKPLSIEVIFSVAGQRTAQDKTVGVSQRLA